MRKCDVAYHGLFVSSSAYHKVQLTQNWSGQGESDCLIKTKHCDDCDQCWRNVISAQCSECQRGGSNYDSLKVAKCLVI